MPRSLTASPVSGKRSPELDGLRGVAIALVLGFHLIAKPLEGVTDQGVLTYTLRGVLGTGWLGVDLFFVLSGFLITDILLHTQRTTSALGRFWLRRGLRILPVYYVGLGLYFLLLPLVLPSGSQLADAWIRGQGWLWTYTSNIGPALVGSWDPIPPLLYHTWSLALEEQFYLLWPLLVLGRAPVFVRKVAFVTIVGAVLFRLVGLLVSVPPLSLYISLFSRMDSLALGAVVATISPGVLQSRHWRWLLLAAPVLVACFLLQGPSQYGMAIQAVGYSAAGILGVFLLREAIHGAEHGWWRLMLRNSALRYAGRRSYALYLVHPPVAALVGYLLFDGYASTLIAVMVQAVVSFVGSIVAAEVSWWLIERPIAEWRNRWPGAPGRWAQPVL